MVEEKPKRKVKRLNAVGTTVDWRAVLSLV